MTESNERSNGNANNRRQGRNLNQIHQQPLNEAEMLDYYRIQNAQLDALPARIQVLHFGNGNN